MKERLIKAANILLLVLTVVILATLQTSFWFQVFGYIPAPALWIPALIFVAVYRSGIEAMLLSALFAFALSTMTSMSDGLLLSSMFLVTISARVFRKRIFWPTSSYTMMLCGFAALFFHIYYLILSLLFEQIKVSSPQIIDWIAEGLLTSLFAPTLFALFLWIDRLTGQEEASRSGTEVI
jgi:hypothetical protein